MSSQALASRPRGYLTRVLPNNVQEGRLRLNMVDCIRSWIFQFNDENRKAMSLYEGLCLLDGGSHLCLSNISVRAPTV